MYVHFPWCLKKCPYCDFLSVVGEREGLPGRAYASAVLAELERRGENFGGRRLASVFFGGGTPSLWAAEELGRVLAGVMRMAGAGAKAGVEAEAGAGAEAEAEAGVEAEITVECNPSSFDQGVGGALREQGVNRVSIGVQSLNEERLRFLGRLHDAEGGLRAVRDALRVGFARVSADLIFGVAGQSVEDAVREALTLAETGVTHLSAYALTIEPGTEFGARAKKGRLPLLDEDVVARSFEAVSSALEGAGFEHYEISNFARDGHRAQHNLGYWRGSDYLGLGVGAWGTLTVGGVRTRYRNTTSPERYLGSAGAWADAVLDRVVPGGLMSQVEGIEPEVALRERIMLGLRLAEGVDLEQVAAELGVEAWTEERRRAAERLVREGRVRRVDSRWVIPRDRWVVADGTIAELM